MLGDYFQIKILVLTRNVLKRDTSSIKVTLVFYKKTDKLFLSVLHVTEKLLFVKTNYF